VPAILPNSHGVGLHAPNPSTAIPLELVATTMSTTLFVAWFVFTHVPASAALGGGGTGVAALAVAACAGARADSSVATAAIELISAAVAARRIRLMWVAPLVERNGQPSGRR
jgi:hypothetical protein